jgi:hypothetical protein
MSTTSENKGFSGLSKQVHRLADLVRQNRVVKALEEGSARYPVFRALRFAARVDLEVLLDAIALDPAWRAERVHATAVILDGDGVFVSGWGTRKADYCSCVFDVWAADVALVEAAKERILAKAGATRITEPMFSIDWNFLSGNDLESAQIEELANDRLHDRAYPEIKEGVQAFIARYLAAPETVLVLQGPPGTGKTRLIRAILGEISQRKTEPARAIYTGDMKALASDAIYVKFITGEDDAFVVEDADHLLKPRADGNEHLHRFLTIADGVVRSQGRKIIFSTNLPNVGDLDEALIRPGRCFARVQVRNLTGAEAQALAEELGSPGCALDAGRRHSLAEVYRAAR